MLACNTAISNSTSPKWNLLVSIAQTSLKNVSFLLHSILGHFIRLSSLQDSATCIIIPQNNSHTSILKTFYCSLCVISKKHLQISFSIASYFSKCQLPCTSHHSHVFVHTILLSGKNIFSVKSYQF